MNISIVTISFTALFCLNFFTGYTCPAERTPLIYADRNYEEEVGTVVLRPSGTSRFDTDPVIPLGQTLHLDFDVIGEESEYLNATIVHCTHDWKPSQIMSLEFLQVYNEFNLDNFSYSNSLIPYTQYQFILPPVTKSGNYLLVVYRDGEEEDLLFSRRFVVYETMAQVEGRVQYSQLARQMQTHQRVEFEVSHPSLNIFNPFRDLQVVILQNHNWHTAKTGLQPTIQRPDQRYLEYHHFSGENEFPGLNEFRFFDLRSTQYRGRNVNAVFRQGDSFSARLGKDLPRTGLAYANSLEDENGAFFIGNTDPGAGLLEADYIYTSFFLEMPQQDEPVYVVGKFNNWHQGEENEMAYEAGLGMYFKEIRLKQGFYNFGYATSSRGFDTVEGNFVETENQYEILVYLTDPSQGYHRVIGYTKISTGH